MSVIVRNPDGTTSEYLTVGETSWTCRRGLRTLLREECWAAGAAGGTTEATAANGGGGGGGGAYVRNTNRTVVEGTVYQCQVGSGALASTTRDSWFGSISRLLAKTGTAGGSVAALGNAGAGGAGGTTAASVGETKIAGGSGATGATATAGGGGGGAGDTSAGSAAAGNQGGAGGSTGGGKGGSQGTAGATYGGGAVGSAGLSAAPGLAGDGIVVLTYIEVVDSTVRFSQASIDSYADTAANRLTVATASVETALAQTDHTVLVRQTSVEVLSQDSGNTVTVRTAQTFKVIAPGLNGTARDPNKVPLAGVEVLVFRDDTNTLVASLTTGQDGKWATGADGQYTYWISYWRAEQPGNQDDIQDRTPKGVTTEPVEIASGT